MKHYYKKKYIIFVVLEKLFILIFKLDEVVAMSVY